MGQRFYLSILNGLHNQQAGNRLKRDSQNSNEVDTEFGTLGLSLIHDLSGSVTSVLMDIERLRLDVHDVENSLKLAQQQILGLESGQLDVGKELDIACQAMEQACQDRNIQIKITGLAEARIVGSSAKLQIVLSNLLRNAIDACSGYQRARIGLSLRKSKGSIELRVQNNGRHIPRDRLQDIFKKGISSKQSGRHLGVGLSLVKHIIERDFRGNIKVTSRPERTEFCISIPMQR